MDERPGSGRGSGSGGEGREPGPQPPQPPQPQPPPQPPPRPEPPFPQPQPPVPQPPQPPPGPLPPQPPPTDPEPPPLAPPQFEAGEPMGETVGVGTGAGAPQASRTPASTTAGWKPALLGAVGTILVLGVIGEALAFLLYAAEDQARPSIADTARFGGFVFYAFHHVGLRFGGAAFGGIGANVTVALAMLTGTLVALWLLALTGRAIANQAGGSSLARCTQGARVSLPY